MFLHVDTYVIISSEMYAPSSEIRQDTRLPLIK